MRETLPYLTDGGDMGARMRATDWAATPFGRPADWPPALRMAVSLCLSTSIPTAIYWGRDLRLLYNDGWAPIAGEKHPWALGRPAREVWADIWHVIEPQLTDVLDSGHGFSVADQMLPMKRGGRIQNTHWDYSFAPIFDDRTGAVLGIFNQGNETTARKHAERALRASEQRLEYALGASNSIGTWDWDVAADRITADPRFARLYGVDPRRAAEGAPLADFFDRIHPDDVASVRIAIDAAIESGEALATEYRLVEPDGTVRWVAAQGRCTLAPDGSPLRFPGVSFDITERKQTEAALRESEARFRGITDSIDQMIWSTLPDGYHDYYNQRWYDYTGVPQGSTDGEAWNGMFHPEDQERAWAVWRHCLETGEPYHIEYRLRHRSGQYRWVLGRAQPVRDEDGRITRWFGTCTDIQEIVDAREVLARSREDLERAVEARTDELMRAEDQLRQAQKMEAVGQLTGGIAHDFNNMLAVILGGLSLLERRLARGETDVQRYVDAAKDGAERAAALTQRLLAFSRRQPLQPEVVDPNRMVAGMTELLIRTLGERIEVRTDLQDGLWTVRADPSQLENAILNLAVNGRDAMMPDGGTLAIATANAEIGEADARGGDIVPGPYVRIGIADTGTGMTADVIARAFDPFFTTKEVGKGSGLGLSQVFGFVRQSGGSVTIDSAPGRGTRIDILLPRYAGDERPLARPQAGEAQGGRPGEIVMVVEDDDRVRAYSVEALRELGYTVVHAASGQAAMRMIDAGQDVSLLFSDLVMPGMAGRELMVLARGKLPHLKVLFTTGYNRGAVDGDDSVIDPSAQLLQKPFTIEQLAAKVRATLDG